MLSGSINIFNAPCNQTIENYLQDPTLYLTKDEAVYLKEQFLYVTIMKDTLMEYCLKTNTTFAEQPLEQIDALPNMSAELKNRLMLAKEFANFIYGAYIVYNLLFWENGGDYATDDVKENIEERYKLWKEKNIGLPHREDILGLVRGHEHYKAALRDFLIKFEVAVNANTLDVSEHNLSQGNMGAKQLLSLLDYMDDSILEYENAEIPERVPSDDDIDTLVNIAIGSPAVCLYRDLKEIVDLEERKKIARECCDKSFVSMFNRPESRSIMDAVFEGKKGSSDEKHYEQVFHYCVDGNFQSMLDEYKFALGVCGEEFVEAIKDAFLQTTTLPYVSQEYYRASFTDRPQSKAPRLRVHFAAGYFDAKTSDKTIQRVNNVRNAFNSPFRPFVLATTSVGQEGLDFHLYSRKVVHWNLPSNPIDLEQREGRINRYMCHAIRQNVGANESAFDWKEKFDKTKEKYGKGTSDMIPYWCLPDEYPFKYQIERIVPMYPFGQDKTKYDRLINVLALYRLTLGQPRQEEMIAILQREDLSKEQMEELFFDLSPYSRNKKKQG